MGNYSLGVGFCLIRAPNQVRELQGNGKVAEKALPSQGQRAVALISAGTNPGFSPCPQRCVESGRASTWLLLQVSIFHNGISHLRKGTLLDAPHFSVLYCFFYWQSVLDVCWKEEMFRNKLGSVLH